VDPGLGDVSFPGDISHGDRDVFQVLQRQIGRYIGIVLIAFHEREILIHIGIAVFVGAAVLSLPYFQDDLIAVRQNGMVDFPDIEAFGIHAFFADRTENGSFDLFDRNDLGQFQIIDPYFADPDIVAFFQIQKFFDNIIHVNSFLIEYSHIQS
jgi:hypothetical protein